MPHTPPSTYILRDLIEVQTSDAVSWWPGIDHLPIGWWYVLTLLSLMSIVMVLITLRHVWKNRYRREALTALQIIMSNKKNSQTKAESVINQTAAEQHFYTLKQVLFYLEPHSATLADNAVLVHLDRLIKSNTWQSELGQRWINSLYNPNVNLSHDDIHRLNKQSQHWLKHHKNQFSFKPLQLLKGQ
ncbi:hypothetical protein GCM10007916_22360 [Psychromonas marina]|uniref:DUF4381 domain-containing protein n=1 Tax=Psychromonas marina TaxID=88364 RepID=A0ABQ6E1G0_9GAMM|nr:DUF4381 domain-containing protein [Psychromonas marina]GLS91167.1 hypothetical protein GCM10007916_22360 [Psychromonas marina]